MGKEKITEDYLPLMDYSAKYGVSLSTLRRRIKRDEIQCVVDSGKYLIPDRPLPSRNWGQKKSTRVVERRIERKEPASEVINPQLTFLPPNPIEQKEASPKLGPTVTTAGTPSGRLTVEDVLAMEERVLQQREGNFHATAQVLSELKKAYMTILQEKEMQVLQLREEVADLRTLVRVLESENARLSRRPRPPDLDCL